VNEAFADAVIVAAGASRRMGGGDKLGADLGGQPLVAWAVNAMAAARSVRRLIFVAAPEMVEYVAHLECLRDTDATIVAGGAQRSDSVLAGVRAADADIVLVHDGARPLVSPTLVDAVARAAAEHGAAIPVVHVSDSLKSVTADVMSGAVEREGLVAAQTPQGARRELLLAAFAAADGRTFSDEASMLQAHGVTVATIAGDVSNIKVTRPDDLELVRSIARGRRGSAEARTGFGQDRPQFGRADGLWLGGVHIADAPRLHGHSDGDVCLHALATALLSAAGLGDLGRLFPADDVSSAGIASSALLRETVAQVTAAGWMATSAQIALSGARPRLGAARLDAMRAAIATIVGLSGDSVAVTASTGNLGGPDGKGLSISATALVTLVRA
jgi:2-C-methyl-D-erythritol 4-phosphate cytidylyltransferase/2-C-methyl-D-erythritol 2,4-cyclodiphosphate synthase